MGGLTALSAPGIPTHPSNLTSQAAKEVLKTKRMKHTTKWEENQTKAKPASVAVLVFLRDAAVGRDGPHSHSAWPEPRG